MKRFFVAVVFCLMIGSLLASCAATSTDKRGYGGKKSAPKQAQEEVIDKDSTTQSDQSK